MKGIAHGHIVNTINTEIRCRLDSSSKHSLRVLDVGFGDGRLINYLMEIIPALNPNVTLEIYGIEVDDFGVKKTGVSPQAFQLLTKQLPSVPWSERLTSIISHEPWSYQDELFDIIVSNQIFEHVMDHELLFAERYRSLCWGGISIHCFPLKHCIYEGHLKLPFVHKIMDYDVLQWYITLLSRIGLGKHGSRSQSFYTSLPKYKRMPDFMLHYTNYPTYQEFLNLGKSFHLRTSFRYTKGLYTTKLRSLLGIPLIYTYDIKRSCLLDRIGVFFLKYISSITLFLEKQDTFRFPSLPANHWKGRTFGQILKK